MVYLATFFPLYREFGWSIYKRIGADRGVKKMYMWFQVFICILKFGESVRRRFGIEGGEVYGFWDLDFFLFVSFSLQLVLLVQQNDLEVRPCSSSLPSISPSSRRMKYRRILMIRIATALVNSRRLTNNPNPPRSGLSSSEEGEARINVGLLIRFARRRWIFHLQGSSLAPSPLFFYSALMRWGAVVVQILSAEEYGLSTRF